MACSIPPMYWSTGIQYFTSSRSNMPRSSLGLQKRSKYQEDSTKVSMVSVSRLAGFPHRGQDGVHELRDLGQGRGPQAGELHILREARREDPFPELERSRSRGSR